MAQRWRSLVQHRIVRFLHHPCIVDWTYAAASHVLDRGAIVARLLARLQAGRIKELLRGGIGLRTLTFSVTNTCNAKCIFCVYPLLEGPPGRLKEVLGKELFKKRVDEAASYGVTAADLTPIVGDPLIDPTIDEKIRYLIDRGFTRVSLTTNAILLARFTERLVGSGVTHLFISLPSCDRADYKSVYGVDGWPAAGNGIACFLQRNRELGEPVMVGFRFRNALKPSAILRSEGFLQTIRPFLSMRVTLNFTPCFDNWGGAITSSQLKGAMRMRHPPKSIRVPCRGLFNLKILPDGKVRLCGCRFRRDEHDELMVGDANTTSLGELAASEKVAQIVDGFFHDRVPACCRECSFYDPITPRWLQSNRGLGQAREAQAPNG